jgi:modification methylase
VCRCRAQTNLPNGQEKLQKRTTTQSFGTGRRENHDSSSFYNRKLFTAGAARNGADEINPIPSQHLDSVFPHSSEEMRELPDNSVALMVTSPPYNVGKEYDQDMSLDEYLGLLGRVLRETHRVLVPGGRVAFNVANIGRKPYIPLNGLVSSLASDIGYLMRGEIIWIKAKGATGSCAWGSWMSAGNPTLRDLHEYVLIFSKQRFDRPHKGRSTISRDEFMAATTSVWHIPAESARRVGHPAPFPVALVERLIHLYTFEGEAVLDPFMGSGSTAVAAVRADRRFVGYEIEPSYVAISMERVSRTAGRCLSA